MSDDLLRDLVGITDQERTVRAALRVERSPCARRPPALLPDIGAGPRIAGKELIGGLLRRRGYIAERVYTNLEAIGWMPGTRTRLTVKIDEGTETSRLSSDDGDHQRQPEDAGPGERLRRATDPQPYRKGILHRAGIDTLASEGGPILAGPVHLFVAADLQQQLAV